VLLAEVVGGFDEAAEFGDAKDGQATAFYAKFGFQAVPGRPLKLFLPMDTVRQFAAAESRKR
jgi:hypothetical protein